MPTRNINLTDHFHEFVEKQIKAGHYSNASEVMRAGLRLLEQQTNEDREKLERLRELALEGVAQLDRGEGIEFSNKGELDKFIAQIGKKVTRSAQQRRRKA